MPHLHLPKLFTKLNQLANRNEFFLLLLTLTLALRLPTLFEPFWYGDENIYLSIGQAIRSGEILYQNITDYPNKPPLIYLFAALVQTVFGFRLLLLLWHLATVYVFFRLVKLTTHYSLIPHLATFVFIFILSTPIIEGTIANAEIFFILPTLFSLLLLSPLFKSPTKPLPFSQLLLSGLFLGIAFLFKIHVLFDIVAFVLYFFIFHPPVTIKKTLLRLSNIRFISFSSMLLVPIVTILIIWSFLGVLPGQLIQNALGSNSYVSVWGQKELLLQTIGFGHLYARFCLLSIITLFLFLFRHRFNPNILFSSLWLSFALFAVLLSTRPYPHYLIQLVPPILLLLTYSLLDRKLPNRLLAIASLLLVVLAFFRFQFKFYPVLPYYQNFYRYSIGQINRNQFYRNHDSRVMRNYQIANFLQTITHTTDRIYVWGDDPEIYTLSNRLPTGKLVASFHVGDLNYYQTTLDQLDLYQTPVIVVTKSDPNTFPNLFQFINSKYVLINTVTDPDYSDIVSPAYIYKRL